MPTRVIPKSEWEEFFRDFMRFHQGWVATVEIFSQALGAQKEVNEMVLAGIVAETQHDGTIAIELMLGETTGSHLTHTIVAPTHVWLESQSESEVLRIRDESDTIVLISCHHSAPPAKVTYGVLQES
jgi:hypothetical protein